MFQQAVAHYQAGRMVEAEAACRELLASDPGCADALHLLGLVAYRAGRLEAAVELMERAVALQPANASCLSNLAEVYRALGRAREAEPLCRRALELSPELTEAHINLGNALHDLLMQEEAAACYRKALSIQPENLLAHRNLGYALRELRKWGEAEHHLRSVLQLNARDVGARTNLALVLIEAGRRQEAEECVREAIALLEPQDAEARNQLGNVLARLGHLPEAEAQLRKAITLRPAYAEAHNNLAAVLKLSLRLTEAEAECREALRLSAHYAAAHCNLGTILTERARPADALAHFREAIRLDPGFAQAHYNLGVTLADLEQFDAAEASYAKALLLDPGYADARWNLGLLKLSAGRFDEGWALYEARYDPRRGPPPFHVPVRASFAQWKGEDLAGKSMLLWAEQGFGDELQFVRYVPVLRDMGVRKLTLVCKTPLLRLFQSLEGLDAILAQEHLEEAPRHDYWSYLLSIPRFLTPSERSIPARLPYLRVPAAAIEQWHARVPRAGFKVGLVWKGSGAIVGRSLDAFSQLRPLWSVPGTSYVSLQIGGSEEIHETADQPNTDLGRDIRDFLDTAAVVSQLDLVISIDTAIAHLAGALGKPCWVLLPNVRNDWRWMLERTDSPWYPGVMRLFRRRHGEGWDATVEAVAAALAGEV